MATQLIKLKEEVRQQRVKTNVGSEKVEVLDKSNFHTVEDENNMLREQLRKTVAVLRSMHVSISLRKRVNISLQLLFVILQAEENQQSHLPKK
jgi:hypothetical protein